MSEMIRFTLDGEEVEARADETIWQVANRRGTEIPHLCYTPAPGYRPDGNCRACMVEVEGERVLAASCIRKPAAGMKVKTASERAKSARKMVFELLLTDQPDREAAHDPDSRLWHWADHIGVDDSRFAARGTPQPDPSHPAMRVNLDACIHCNLCVRACREVQVNDVIGMAGRGHHAKIVFDFDDPMGNSTCVACGECVQACPTGALMPATLLNEQGVKDQAPDRAVDSVCPYCGVGCQLTYQIKDDKLLFVQGRDGPANENRLCVKGRFGFDYVHHDQRLTTPLIRKEGVPKHADDQVDPANPWTHFRKATWDEALKAAASGLKRDPRRAWRHRPCRVRLGQMLQRRSLSVPEAGPRRLQQQQRRPLHAALPRVVGGGAVRRHRHGRGHGAVHGGQGRRCHHRHRRQPDREPSGRGDLLQAGGQARRQADRHGSARHGDEAPRDAYAAVQAEQGRGAAERDAQRHRDGGALRPAIRAGAHHRFRAAQASTSPLSRRRRWSPNAASPPDTIREVARLYARSEASIIFWGMGISQSVHGTNNARCLIALALTTGQVGRPGTGLHPLRGQNNVQGASDAGLIPMFFPDYQSVENADFRAKYEKLWGVSLPPKRGLTVVEVMGAIHAGQIRGMYIMGENPAMSDPDAHHAREALAKLEHLVVQDIFLTETAFHADVVLPASAWPEKDGTVTNTNRQVQMGRQALPKPGDARDDWWITQELARGMGLDWSYAHPRDAFAEMASVMPSFANITWERLMRESAVTYPTAAPDQPGKDIVFGDGVFPTPTKRGKLVPAAVQRPGRADR